MLDKHVTHYSSKLRVRHLSRYSSQQHFRQTFYTYYPWKQGVRQTFNTHFSSKQSVGQIFNTCYSSKQRLQLSEVVNIRCDFEALMEDRVQGHAPHSADYKSDQTTTTTLRVQELCESRGGPPGLSVLMSPTVSVD